MKLTIFITLFGIFLCQNSTDCMLMYQNGSITEHCEDYNTCCLVNYSYHGFPLMKCIRKYNITDDICGNLTAVYGMINGAYIDFCDCFGNFFDFSTFKLFSLIIIIYSFILY
jgi:hypothetical protein